MLFMQYESAHTGYRCSTLFVRALHLAARSRQETQTTAADKINSKSDYSVEGKKSSCRETKAPVSTFCVVVIGGKNGILQFFIC